MYNSENDIDECSDKSDWDIEYNTKKGCSRKKLKHEEKLNNNKKNKKVEVCRDVQPNYKRATTARSINTAMSNVLETKGMHNICTYYVQCQSLLVIFKNF